MNKVKRGIEAAFLVAIFFTVCVFSVRSTLWKNKSIGNFDWIKLDSGWELEPDRTSPMDGSIAVQRTFYAQEFQNSLGENAKNVALFFITHNQSVRVYCKTSLGESLIYDYATSGLQFAGSESGNATHFVRLPEPDDAFSIIVQLVPSYFSANFEFFQFYHRFKRAKVPDFFVGHKDDMLFRYVFSSAYQWIPILIILLNAAICIYTFVIFLILHIPNKRFLFLGFSLLLFGFSLFFESNVGFLLFKNSFLEYFISTEILTLYPILFMFYMNDRKLILRTEKISRVISNISVVNFLLVSLGSFVTAIPFLFIRFYVMVYILFVLGYMFFVEMKDVVSMKGFKDIDDIMMSIACASMILDLLLALPGGHSTDVFFFTRIGLTFFTLTFTFSVLTSFHETSLTKARVELVHEMARKDYVTGCLAGSNLWQYSEQKFLMLVVELDNMAEIVQTQGIGVGDSAIRDFARILKSVFIDAKIYRMNSARFCILQVNGDKSVCAEQMSRVSQSVDAYNLSGANARLSIAFVQDFFRPNVDTNVDDCYRRLLNQLDIL